ncbi:MAG: hypothetical protein IKO32_08660, partial [Lachnospiraceae bacterium]|nr:hypothetical protein [Lachnospiraceae bacterium]
NVEGGLESLNGSAASLYGIVLWIAGILGIGVSALITIAAIASAVSCVLFVIFEYLIPAITLFIMAKKAGYKYPWLALIPVAQTYLEYVLPRREFNLLFRTRKRNFVAVFAIVLTYFGTGVFVALNILPAVGQVISLFIPIVFMLLTWRRKYDVVRTYRDRGFAIAVATIDMFVPIIYPISLIISVRKEPEYGFDNYYNVYMEDY